MDSSEPWYKDGLRFECTRCGRCCRGDGNVWVSDDEIAALAAQLDRSDDEFRASHTRRAGKRGISLRQKRNQECIFWNAKTGCEVYELRPRQCRTYPFWSALIQDAETWHAEGQSCPGIGDGELYPVEKIIRTAADDGIPPHRTRLRGGRPA